MFFKKLLPPGFYFRIRITTHYMMRMNMIIFVINIINIRITIIQINVIIFLLGILIYVTNNIWDFWRSIKITSNYIMLIVIDIILFIYIANNIWFICCIRIATINMMIMRIILYFITFNWRMIKFILYLTFAFNFSINGIWFYYFKLFFPSSLFLTLSKVSLNLSISDLYRQNTTLVIILLSLDHVLLLVL